MARADRVHSTPPTNTPIADDPSILLPRLSNFVSTARADATGKCGRTR